MALGQERGILGRITDAVMRGIGRRRASVPAPQPVGAEIIEGVGWNEFELRVAEGFRHRGYTVSETGGGGGRTIDMVLTRGQERFLVDCKPWRATAVGAAPVRELHRLVRLRRAAGGFVISSGLFTPEARKLAQDHQIQLIDGTMLRELLESREEKTQPVVVRRAGPFLDSTLPPSAWRVRALPCPLCGGAMVEGERDGRRLLICTHHPLCEGTRELEP